MVPSFLSKNGRLILDWPRPQEITSNGWNASYRFHQPDLEAILTKGVERFDNVTVWRGTKGRNCAASARNFDSVEVLYRVTRMVVE